VAMPVSVTCPACATSFELAEYRPGRKMSCPNCWQTLDLAGPAPAVPAAAIQTVPPPSPPPAPRNWMPLVLVLLVALVLGGGTIALAVVVFSGGDRDRGREVAQQDSAAKPKDKEQRESSVQPPPKKEVEPDSVRFGPPSIRLKSKIKQVDAGTHRLDKFGNPEESVGLYLGKNLKGSRLLVWSGEPEAIRDVMQIDPNNPANPAMKADNSPLWRGLKDKGFVLTFQTGKFDPEWLKQTDQLWIFSGQKDNLDEPSYQAIEAFARVGKGLYLLADNEPYLQEANALTRRLFGTTIQGNYGGQKIAYVPRPEVTPDLVQKFGGNYQVPDHPILTGVNFIYEGVTISNVAPNPKLETVLKASDGQILVAVAVDPNVRVVVDCGWTRYMVQFLNTAAGTMRFGENVAVYLAGE
jgi:hypothetical protein